MLEKEDFEFIAGCCLGDGSLNGKNKGSINPVFSISHSVQQEDYLMWKVEKFRQIFKAKCTVGRKTITLNDKQHTALGFGVSSPELWSIYNLLYPNGKKMFTWELLKLLGNQALALFWMDDGVFTTRTHITTSSKTFRGNCGQIGLVRKGFREARLSLYTGKEEANLVNSWIRDLTGAEGYLYDQKRNGKYIIIWHKKDFLRIVENIKSFVHPSMYRKISLDGCSFNLETITIGEGESAAKSIEVQI